MEFPVTIDSQDAFDALVKDRIKRAEAKAVERFADYDELKTKATSADADRQRLETDLAAAVARAETAEGQVQQFQTEKQVNDWRAEVAAATGVPADALRGSTKEDFEAHAAVLKPLVTGSGPVIPSQGETPQQQTTASPWSGVLDTLAQQRGD